MLQIFRLLFGGSEGRVKQHYYFEQGEEEDRVPTRRKTEHRIRFPQRVLLWHLPRHAQAGKHRQDGF